MYTNCNQRVCIFLFVCYNYNRGLHMDYFERYKKLKEKSINAVIENDRKKAIKPMLICKGFIGDQTELKPYSDHTVGFKMDDQDVYFDFIKIKGNEDKNISKDISLIQQTLDNYFVGGMDEVKAVAEEQQKLGNNIHSIKDYKNRGGQCIQKSAMANNFLQILGYDCKMVLADATNGTNRENHAFIVIQDKENNVGYIYDPTNRSKMYYGEQNVAKIPTLVIKSLEQIDSFLNCNSDLQITQEDEDLKNGRQQGDIKIEIPKMKYEARDTAQIINLQNYEKNQDISDYVNRLVKKGLTNDEIAKVLNNIQTKAMQGQEPQIKELMGVYKALADNQADIGSYLPNNKSQEVEVVL